MNKLLTIAEAAELLKVHPETLRRWDREGILTAVKVNNRGDRRYNHDTLTDFMKTNKDTIKYADPIEHQGYSIKWDFEGIITLSASFDRMARFIVKKDEGDLIGFIFYISLLSAHSKDKDELETMVLEKVKEILSSRKPTDGDRFTFEFESGQFVEVENPDWWEEKYSKPLLPGLRVVAEHTCPYSSAQKSWRVTLRFKCKQGGIWVTNSFGDQKQFHEYYAWITSEELIKQGLPVTAKSAEVLAVEFGLDRFEKTKDAQGDGDISNISENNSSMYEGKWHIDSMLPEEMS
jgi:excisionase family DNA binding protein